MKRSSVGSLWRRRVGRHQINAEATARHDSCACALRVNRPLPIKVIPFRRMFAMATLACTTGKVNEEIRDGLQYDIRVISFITHTFYLQFRSMAANNARHIDVINVY